MFLDCDAFILAGNAAAFVALPRAAMNKPVETRIGESE